jgi:hypothetical protein
MIGGVDKTVDGVDYTIRFTTSAMLAASKAGVEVVPWMGRAMALDIKMPEVIALARHGLKDKHGDVPEARVIAMIDTIGLGAMVKWLSDALALAMDGPKSDGEPGE